MKVSYIDIFRNNVLGKRIREWKGFVLWLWLIFWGKNNMEDIMVGVEWLRVIVIGNEIREIVEGYIFIGGCK